MNKLLGHDALYIPAINSFTDQLLHRKSTVQKPQKCTMSGNSLHLTIDQDQCKWVFNEEKV